MSNVPTKGLFDDRRGGIKPLPVMKRSLKSAGRKNPNMGSSTRGRMGGGGFVPGNRV